MTEAVTAGHLTNSFSPPRDEVQLDSDQLLGLFNLFLLCYKVSYK